MDLKTSLIELSKEENALPVCEELISSLETIIECGNVEEYVAAASLIKPVQEAQREILNAS